MNTPYLEDMADEEPLYNIGVVTRMTGIPVATLRVWERRYGFPKSARTPGGHRLYSDRDLARLQWVRARIDEGMQTGQAIRALHHLEQEGRRVEYRTAAQAAARRNGQRTPLDPFRERLLAALIRHDTEKADQVLGDVLALYAPEDLALGLIAPAMADIGQAWLDGRLTVATEHLSTNYLRHRLLMWMVTGPTPHPVPPIVLACAPDELHEGSLLMLGVVLRRHRWPVVYLGQTVPLSDLAQLVKEMRVSAIVLVAMTEEPARALIEWPQWLPDAQRTGRPIVAYGGRVFTETPEWRERVPGRFLGSSLQEGLDTLEPLLRDTTVRV